MIYERIELWFSHRHFQRGNRDKELGKKMARIIFVSVSLSGKNGEKWNRIKCRDRITVREAPSIPQQ